MSGNSDITSVQVRRAELLDLKTVQLDIERAAGARPTLAEVIRHLIDAYAGKAGSRG